LEGRDGGDAGSEYIGSFGFEVARRAVAAAICTTTT
jgi:hypothetical protein